MLNKEQWITLMRSVGLNDADLHKWHREFETMSGQAHQEFLEILGITPSEIKEIRSQSV